MAKTDENGKAGAKEEQGVQPGAPYSYTLVGVDSPFDLMKTDFGEYGEVNKAWSADDVKGFTKILGNQMKIYHNVQKRNGKE